MNLHVWWIWLNKHLLYSDYIPSFVLVARNINMIMNLWKKFLEFLEMLLSFEEIICFLLSDTKDYTIYHFSFYETFTARRWIAQFNIQVQ